MNTGMKFLRAVWPLEDAMSGGDIPPGRSVAVDPCTVPRDQLAVTEGVSASSVHSPMGAGKWGALLLQALVWGGRGISSPRAQSLPFPCPEG